MAERLSPLAIMQRLVAFPTVSRDTNLPLVDWVQDYASRTIGKMHAGGHDGHSEMLLGAARYLAETRNFDGTVVLIFQPAKEGGGGREMCRVGLMDRWGIQEVYGMHNMPGEDFVYLLEQRPGAHMFIANGDTGMCHHPAYDFNDDAIPPGCSWFVELVETRTPVDN